MLKKIYMVFAGGVLLIAPAGGGALGASGTAAAPSGTTGSRRWPPL